VGEADDERRELVCGFHTAEYRKVVRHRGKLPRLLTVQHSGDSDPPETQTQFINFLIRVQVFLIVPGKIVFWKDFMGELCPESPVIGRRGVTEPLGLHRATFSMLYSHHGGTDAADGGPMIENSEYRFILRKWTAPGLTKPYSLRKNLHTVMKSFI
jgi:hypothetical protein